MNLVTVSEIAAAVEQPPARVSHVLRTRTTVKLVRRAGSVRLFDADVIPFVKAEIAAIDAKQAAAASA